MGVSSFTNKVALSVGAMNGTDSVLIGGAVGAGVGAISGAFSDHDTMLSGAIKGGMIGAPMGYGTKYIGSRYSKGFLNAHGSQGFADTLSGKASHNWNTDYFTKGKFDDKESFMNRFG